nr:hypothetical protein BaRGS_008923 [Batillaria attramentaria]
MIGRVHADLFSQEKFLLNGVDLRMRLTRSKDAFSLMAVEDGGAYPQYRVQIVHASLFVRKCKLNPAVVLGHARALEKATAKYPIQRVVTRVISIPAGNLNVVQDNLFLDQLPKQLFIGLVDSTAFNGHYAGSPFEFKHYHLNFLALYQEGKQVPVKALKPNFVNGEYMRSYMSLFSGTNTSWKDVGNTISPSDYDKGYTLYGFDLTPSLVDGNQAELIRAGSLRLEMSFALGLQAPVHVILYAQFDGLIEIDKSRQVCVDVFEYEETTDSFIVKQRGGSEDFPDILNVLYFRGHFCYIKTKNKEEKMEEEEEKMETESDVDEKEEEEDDDEDNEEKTETADVDEHPFRFLIKRHNDFMCICTEKLKFLDIINYLAPGTCRQSTQFVAVLIPIGFFVYQYAKLRMLQFHYDLVDKFVSRADYQLCEMDTDSLYMALSTSSFEEAVKPELRQDFYTHYNECSTQGDKSRAKGLNQKLNQLTKDTYLQVLNTQTSGGGVNRGFRTDGQMMYTYTQERKSLSYLYIKRQRQMEQCWSTHIFMYMYHILTQQAWTWSAAWATTGLGEGLRWMDSTRMQRVEETSEGTWDCSLGDCWTEGWTAGWLDNARLERVTSEGTWDCSLGDYWTVGWTARWVNNTTDQEPEVNRAAGQHPEKDCTAGQHQEMGDSVGYDKIGHAEGHHPDSDMG